DTSAKPPSAHLAYQWFATVVKERIRSERLDACAWGDKVGWDVRDLLDDPDRVADLNVDALMDISAAVEVDWRSVLGQ
ncbi:MAG TPA: hypothetical protein VGK73_20180, partial [Polyangiaceae bacterium]